MPEIAELSSTEKSAVAEHAESLTRPETPEAAFKEFASKVIGAKKAETKDERPRPEGKPFDLSNTKSDSPEYREWSETGKVSPKAEAKKEPSESQHGSETTAGTKEGEINTRAEVEPRIREIGEKAWTQKLEGQDLHDFVSHVDKTAQTSVDFISKHANRQQIETGLREVFGGLPHAQAQAMYSDLTLALSEIKNPGEVLATIGMDKLTRDAFRLAPTRAHMRAAVHGLAMELLQKSGSAKPAARTPEVRLRAPKPPSILGNGAPAERADIAAARAGNFKAFDQEMRARYSRAR
jgi:hypothetical protein